MDPLKLTSNPYRYIIRHALTSDSAHEPLPEIHERHKERKKLLLESLGKVRKEILKAVKELKKQMPGLAVSENVPRRDYHAIEYNFISASGEFCRAELY